MKAKKACFGGIRESDEPLPQKNCLQGSLSGASPKSKAYLVSMVFSAASDSLKVGQCFKESLFFVINFLAIFIFTRYSSFCSAYNM